MYLCTRHAIVSSEEWVEGVKDLLHVLAHSFKLAALCDCVDALGVRVCDLADWEWNSSLSYWV